MLFWNWNIVLSYYLEHYFIYLHFCFCISLCDDPKFRKCHIGICAKNTSKKQKMFKKKKVYVNSTSTWLLSKVTQYHNSWWTSFGLFIVDLVTYITRFQWDMAKYPIKQSLKNISEIISKVGLDKKKNWGLSVSTFAILCTVVPLQRYCRTMSLRLWLLFIEYSKLLRLTTTWRQEHQLTTTWRETCRT